MANLQLGIPVSRPLGTQPTAWRATAGGTPRRLEQGWKGSTCDSQAPGAGRSSTTFWHETGRKGESGSHRLWKKPWAAVQREALAEAAWIRASQAEMQARRKSREILL